MMVHIKIFYDFIVILIGFAALGIALFWVAKTKESYLRDFSILYAFFTGVIFSTILMDYLVINQNEFSSLYSYFLTGLKQIFHIIILVATLNFLLGIYQVTNKKKILLIFVGISLLSIILFFTPLGTRLDPAQNSIELGLGYKIGIGFYFVTFTAVIILGYGLLKRVWTTDKRIFVLGLLIFATIGYLETLVGIVPTYTSTTIPVFRESGFLFSSIPYALYGIFLVYYL